FDLDAKWPAVLNVDPSGAVLDQKQHPGHPLELQKRKHRRNWNLGEIAAQRLARDSGAAALPGADDDSVDAREHLFGAPRLGDEVVDAETIALQAILRLAESGDEEDRHRRQRGPRAHDAEELPSVHLRHLDVEQQDIGRAFETKAERFDAIGGFANRVAAT